MDALTSTASLWLVLLAATATAVATGLGAVPMAARWRIDRRRVAIGTALAAGLMLGASAMLLAETAGDPVALTGLGVAVGAIGVWAAHRRLEALGDVHVYQLRGADARKALLIMGVMTAHSAAEGVGVGVSFADTERLGLTMAAVIAVHNIPEGLAIALVLVPRGVGWLAAAFWSVVSSLPQPVLAVPAFVATSTAEVLLPAGLGFAAGAMAWLALFDMIPEAAEELEHRLLIPALALGAAAMAAVATIG
ncbi:MAG: ZIP family metal transporter [Alphaproteobacteria bacterium]|jgi:zinc transporter ZupT|nr:ZIP family metal transporter [Alphaproteobacteria bacterium]